MEFRANSVQQSFQYYLTMQHYSQFYQISLVFYHLRILSGNTILHLHNHTLPNESIFDLVSSLKLDFVAMFSIQRLIVEINLEFHSYFSLFSTVFSFSSSSWIWSMRLGAPSMTSRPWLFLGKAMQSRMLSRPAKSDTKRSSP